MKKILCILIAFIALCASSTTVCAQSKPKMDGLTFTSSAGETLDFYSSSVVYHAQGSDVSRKGDYQFGGPSVVHGVGDHTWSITVYIYVGTRTVTLKGTVKAKDNGSVLKLILDGEEWRR